MNEEIIQEIERRMLPHLNNEQLKKLKNVLEDTLHGFTVLPSEDAQKSEMRLMLLSLQNALKDVPRRP